MPGNGGNDWGFAPNPTRERVPLTLTTLSLRDSWGKKNCCIASKRREAGNDWGFALNPTRERRSLDPYYAIALR